MAKLKKTNTIEDQKSQNTKGVLTVTVKLSASITKEDNFYVVYCPSLKICSQGESKKEAKQNIIEAVDLFIESCVSRGKLTETLKRLGFKKLEQLNRAERRKTESKNTITFPIELPLAA